MCDTTAQFRRWLTKHGKKFTRERAAVATTLFNMSVPVTQAGLITEVERSFPHRISRATLIRTLTLLCEAGLVIKSDATTDADLTVYSIVRQSLNPRLCATEHHNLVSGRCPWCGGLIIDGELQD